METREEPSCALLPSELADRRTSWAELATQAVARRAEPGRILATYPISILDRFRVLVEAEAECCPFLQFTVSPGDQAFDVELRFPEEFQPVIDAVLT